VLGGDARRSAREVREALLEGVGPAGLRPGLPAAGDVWYERDGLVFDLLPDQGRRNFTFECFYDEFTDRFWGRAGDATTSAWKQEVLAVPVPVERNCAYLEIFPGRCGGAPQPPDLVALSEATDETYNETYCASERNRAINDLVKCSLSDVNTTDETASDEVDTTMTTLSFSLRRDFSVQCNDEVVESIPLKGAGVGYGRLPRGSDVVAQRRGGDGGRGGEVCFAYEYMYRRKITERHSGVCREACVAVDGERTARAVERPGD